MATHYRIYSSAAPGGPVDYSAPAGDTAALSFDSAPLPTGATTFAVHPYDTVTGLEDRSADSRVTVTLDASGSDAGLLPLPPQGLHARALAGGAARLVWAYPPAGRARGFNLYLWPAAGPPDYSAPAATLSARAGLAPNDASPRASFALTVTGLTGGTTYAGAVRAFNAAGEEANTTAVTFTASAAGPSPVVGLSATISS